MKVALPTVAMLAAISVTMTTAMSQQHALFVRRDAFRNGKTRVTREAPSVTSADQMVQNILQWLQGVYAQNSRRIRQGTFREYLPPTNTQKPRPFESNDGGVGSATEDNFIGYPPAGFSPNPPFVADGGGDNTEAYTPYPTQKPAGFTSSSEGYPPPVASTPQPPVETPATHPPQTPPPTHPPQTPPPTHPPQTLPPPTTYPPPGHIVSTTEAPFTSEPQAPGELHQPPTTESNEVKTDSEQSGSEDEEALKHPPHIHDIGVECAKNMMTINVEFNRQFDGVIYSKGHYASPECRYVGANSGAAKYSFTVGLNSCGTEFVNAFDTHGQSYLENVLVLQNEPGIQEVWDTVRAVRCLWEGNLSKALSVALSVGMLAQEIVTFSGDTAVAKLDIQLGRGPFAPPANGLVKIGDTMTLVVSVSGDPGFDIQVKDCRATDAAGEHAVALTDDDGCVVKPKLFGAFQKTRNTGATGASIVAYAFFNAFKFPDVMDLLIECNVELCKTDCETCAQPDQKLEPGRRRRRRDAANDTTPPLGEPVRVGKTLRVILPEDLSEGEEIVNVGQRREVCLSTESFVVSSAVLISLLTSATLFSAYQWHTNQRLRHKY